MADVEELIKRINKKSNDDLYKILGVSKEASSGELTKAYRKLALKLHPDKCTLDGGDDAFKKVSNAFTILKDDEQRSHYDRFGSVGEVGHSGGGGNPFHHGGVPFDPEDLFREMFRDHPAFARGGRGGGGFPGGVQFSFNGMPMGGGGARQQQQPTPLKLPEPFQTILSAITAIIPTPFLVLGSVFLFMYLATAVIGLILRNLAIVIGLTMIPLHGQIKTVLWILFFGGGVLGYL